MSPLNLFAVATAALLALFAGHCAAAPLIANELVKLPSGHFAKILSVTKIEYSKGVLALMVRYQTSLSMDETKAVSAEVDEIWKMAETEADRAGLGDAIISSTHTVKGILLTTSREVNFIYEKGSDGKWTRLERGGFMAAE